MIITDLKEYQKKALEAIKQNITGDVRGYGLFMDMGTGKTLVALSYCDYLFNKGLIRKCIIICPKSIMYQWKNEIIKHTDIPLSNIGIAHGTYLKRRNVLAKHKYVIINFDGCKVIPAELVEEAKNNDDLVIIDESSFIKHRSSQRTRLIHIIGDYAKYKLILTGAPITTGAENIWSQFRYTNPEIFGKNFYRFMYKWLQVEIVTGVGTKPFRKIVGVKDEEKFRKAITSGAFIIKKEDCLDLPEQIFYPPRVFDLNEKHEKMYKKLAKEYLVILEDRTITYNHKLQVLSKLRQVANGFLYTDDGTKHIPQNRRLIELRELIEELDYTRNKIIIVYAFKEDKKFIQQVLKKMNIDKYSCIDEHHKTSAELKKFQDLSCPVLIGQIQRLSHGLDCYFATAMIHYSQYWSTDMRRQVFNRIHRIGQKKKTLYVDLAAKGTIDIGILKIHERNIKLSEALIQSSAKDLIYGYEN